jgi:glutathione peroxidase
MVRIYDVPVTTIAGEQTTLAHYADDATLIVNVASRCGLTPQYEGLEELQQELGGRGLVVLGFPCNQFAGQEPGTEEEIATFCSATYGVTFPMFAKVEVNGPGRHPLYEQLTDVPDAEGKAGDVAWNFEKFLVAPGGQDLRRFRPLVEPDAPELREAIEAVLPR